MDSLDVVYSCLFRFIQFYFKIIQIWYCEPRVFMCRRRTQTENVLGWMLFGSLTSCLLVLQV